MATRTWIENGAEIKETRENGSTLRSTKYPKGARVLVFVPKTQKAADWLSSVPLNKHRVFCFMSNELIKWKGIWTEKNLMAGVDYDIA